ncbi:hypothetical protein E2C01_011467 [Portunus trituberculatus]|uniref:Ig-like domain-containing protein n=1 Tax=Portunus trituberculatus TaxID=210409 RepID=A0A5B7DBH4_PORTR|nr:hypothetical protein [Portunus trituberculatus]
MSGGRRVTARSLALCRGEKKCGHRRTGGGVPRRPPVSPPRPSDLTTSSPHHALTPADTTPSHLLPPRPFHTKASTSVPPLPLSPAVTSLHHHHVLTSSSTTATTAFSTAMFPHDHCDPRLATPPRQVNKSLDDPFYMHELDTTDNSTYSSSSTQVHIEGAHERYIQRGSILAITCTVDHKGRAGPRQVAWYQGAARLHYDSPRGGIALQVCSASWCV